MICLSTGVSSSSSTEDKSDDSYSCLKPVLPFNKRLSFQGTSKVEKADKEKCILNATASIVRHPLNKDLNGYYPIFLNLEHG